jgi:hypothetical protein
MLYGVRRFSRHSSSHPEVTISQIVTYLWRIFRIDERAEKSCGIIGVKQRSLSAAGFIQSFPRTGEGDEND